MVVLTSEFPLVAGMLVPPEGDFGLERSVLLSAGVVSADAALLQRIVQAWPCGAGGAEKCPQYGRAVLGTPGQGEFGQLGTWAYPADPDVRAGRRPHAGGAKPDADPAGGQADDGVHVPGGVVGSWLGAVREQRCGKRGS